MKHTAALLLALAIMPAYTYAALSERSDSPVSTDQRAIIDQVIDGSGLGDMIVQMAKMAELDVEKLWLEDVAPEEKARVKKALLEAQSALKLRQAVSENLRKEYDEKKFKALVHMLNGSLVKKMTQLETEAGKPEAQPAVAEYLNGLNTTPPPQTRIMMLQKLFAATHGEQAIMDMQIAVVHGLMVATKSLRPVEEQSDEFINQQLEQMKTQMRPAIQQMLMGYSLYTYRDVSDEELAEYIKTFETEIGQWSMKMFSRILADSFHQISLNIGQVIAQEKIKPKEQAS